MNLRIACLFSRIVAMFPPLVTPARSTPVMPRVVLPDALPPDLPCWWMINAILVISSAHVAPPFSARHAPSAELRPQSKFCEQLIGHGFNHGWLRFPQILGRHLRPYTRFGKFNWSAFPVFGELLLRIQNAPRL